jgi:hypothetical protein
VAAVHQVVAGFLGPLPAAGHARHDNSPQADAESGAKAEREGFYPQHGG